MKLFPAKLPWAGNIAKTMTSNGKQCTVTREMLTAVARDRWNLSAVFKFCFCFVLLYNKSLNDWSLGQQWILFPSNLNVSLDFVSGNIEVLGKQNSLFPSGPVIKCLVHICNISAQMWVFFSNILKLESVMASKPLQNNKQITNSCLNSHKVTKSTSSTKRHCVLRMKFLTSGDTVLS